MMRRFAAIVAFIAVVVSGGALLIAQPRTNPPVEPAIVNMISDFAQSHPDWAVLREQRKDGATVALNHARHMNPDTVGMQEDLAAADGRVAGVEHLAARRRALTCASCHEQDAVGRYMEPVSFDRHCVACHEGDLPRVGGQRVPHGDMPALVDQVNRHLLRRQLDEMMKSANGAVLNDGRGSLPGMVGAGFIAEGSMEWFALRPPPRTSESEAAPPESWRGEDIESLLAEARHDEFSKLKTSCMKCHTMDSITPAPRRPKGEPFDVKTPMIPDRWLNRSVFAHQSHRALNCLQCHSQAIESTQTADIMLPPIDSCRACHAPAAGVRSDCVMCHVYHPPLSPQPPGTITIEEYAASGARVQD